MTDQGIFFLALHFLIEACIVTARWTWERVHPDYNPCKYPMLAAPHTVCPWYFQPRPKVP